MVLIPRHNLRGRLLVERHLGPIVNNLRNLVRRQHTGRARAGPAAAALGELAPGLEAGRAFHGEGAAVEAQAEVHARRVDVVAPEELEGFFDLGEVRVGAGIGAEGLDGRIPDAVCCVLGGLLVWKGNRGSYGCRKSSR